MNFTQRIIIILLSVAAFMLCAFIALSVYFYIADDITHRVRKGVSQGIGEGVVDAVNPLKLPGKLLGVGGGSKKK